MTLVFPVMYFSIISMQLVGCVPSFSNSFNPFTSDFKLINMRDFPNVDISPSIRSNPPSKRYHPGFYLIKSGFWFEIFKGDLRFGKVWRWLWPEHFVELNVQNRQKSATTKYGFSNIACHEFRSKNWWLHRRW